MNNDCLQKVLEYLDHTSACKLMATSRFFEQRIRRQLFHIQVVYSYFEDTTETDGTIADSELFFFCTKKNAMRFLTVFTLVEPEECITRSGNMRLSEVRVFGVDFFQYHTLLIK